MEPSQFKSLVESVNDFLTGKTDQDELTIAEEMVGEYLDLYFADTVNEDIQNEDIEDALADVLELAEAIELVMELKMPTRRTRNNPKILAAYKKGSDSAMKKSDNEHKKSMSAADKGDVAGVKKSHGSEMRHLDRSFKRSTRSTGM